MIHQVVLVYEVDDPNEVIGFLHDNVEPKGLVSLDVRVIQPQPQVHHTGPMPAVGQ